jgi:hypothetical protein
LNRDPAAITSLSVACRCASRPPSDPTITQPFKNLAALAGFSRFLGTFFFHPEFPKHFSAFLSQPAATYCQHADTRTSPRDDKGQSA